MKWLVEVEGGREGSAGEVTGQGSRSLLTDPSPWCRLGWQMVSGWKERVQRRGGNMFWGRGSSNHASFPLYGSTGGRCPWVLAMPRLWPRWRRLHLLPPCAASRDFSGCWCGMWRPFLGADPAPGFWQQGPFSSWSRMCWTQLAELWRPQSTHVTCTDVAHKGFKGHYCLCGRVEMEQRWVVC